MEAVAAAAAARTLVFYPSPGMGHLVSMIELAKLFVTHGFHATIIVLDPPFNTGSGTAAFLSSISSSHPSISFHRLPSISLSHLTTIPAHHETLHLELIRLSEPNLHSYLSSLPSPPAALLLDFFCASAIDVARRLTIPPYFFFTSSAACLATFLHLPVLDSTTTQSFKDLGHSPVHIPGVDRPIPANHMVLPILDRHDAAYAGFLSFSRLLADADGILINTFDSLEHNTIQSIQTPAIYAVGPLIVSERSTTGKDQERPYCLTWLDKQPKSSVVFLCFGSLGRFTSEQMKEIAFGLENSGHRFLWVVRSPPSKDPSKKYTPPPEPDLDVLLPAGFLDRTRDRGLVVKSWAPQAAVLRHEAVGGFVTHLGWNSVLEGICAGVAMVGWPLYAEQWMNKVFVVDDMGLATAVEGYDKEVVKAEEVERRVRELMEEEKGVEIGRRVRAAKESAAAAAGTRGTSYMAVANLVRRWSGE